MKERQLTKENTTLDFLVKEAQVKADVAEQGLAEGAAKQQSLSEQLEKGTAYQQELEGTAHHSSDDSSQRFIRICNGYFGAVCILHGLMPFCT